MDNCCNALDALPDPVFAVDVMEPMAVRMSSTVLFVGVVPPNAAFHMLFHASSSLSTRLCCNRPVFVTLTSSKLTDPLVAVAVSESLGITDVTPAGTVYVVPVIVVNPAWLAVVATVTVDC